MLEMTLLFFFAYVKKALGLLLIFLITSISFFNASSLMQSLISNSICPFLLYSFLSLSSVVPGGFRYLQIFILAFNLFLVLMSERLFGGMYSLLLDLFGWGGACLQQELIKVSLINELVSSTLLSFSRLSQLICERSLLIASQSARFRFMLSSGESGCSLWELVILVSLV